MTWVQEVLKPVGSEVSTAGKPSFAAQLHQRGWETHCCWNARGEGRTPFSILAEGRRTQSLRERGQQAPSSYQKTVPQWSPPGNTSETKQTQHHTRTRVYSHSHAHTHSCTELGTTVIPRLPAGISLPRPCLSVSTSSPTRGLLSSVHSKHRLLMAANSLM